MIVVLVLFMIFVPAASAEAYLDPGTGSYLTQWLVAAIVGSLVALRVYWGRLSSWLSRRWTSPDRTDPTDPSGKGAGGSAPHD